MTQPDGERLAALEEWRKGVDATMLGMSAKVDQMHGVLMQAKGARWAILAAASLAGVLASLAAKWILFIGIKQ